MRGLESKKRSLGTKTSPSEMGTSVKGSTTRAREKWRRLIWSDKGVRELRRGKKKGPCGARGNLEIS